MKSEDIEYPWLKETWLQDTLDNGAIQSYVESDTAKSGKTWIADQVCMSSSDILSSYLQRPPSLRRFGDSRTTRRVTDAT